MSERKSKSPYQRYNKSPYQYSPLYQQWKAAAKAGQYDRARELSKQHTERWLGQFIKRREAA